MTSNPDNVELHLAHCNERLAQLLGTGPLELDRGGQEATRDALWVWGIVGGKDVGKTTLINALAGADVVSPGQDVGQGTFQPAAYLASADLQAARTRLGDLTTEVQFHAQAPDDMSGLVLVDLPDFDSFFAQHAAQVHRVVTHLDGIIWVTTPKKVGDLRAIREISTVLKSRSNFVFVVNKIDWLIAQADPATGTPQADLDRLRSALGHQIAECDADGSNDRAFLISAKYPQPADLLDAIHSHQEGRNKAQANTTNGQLAQAAQDIASQFQALRACLTTAPTADAALDNKRANLTYQVRRQAQTLLDHHRPSPLLDRLEQQAGPERLAEIVEHGFDADYCGQVFERLNAGPSLTAQWSSALFKARILHWPLLGFIAWPASAVGSALRALGSFLPGADRPDRDDPFRTAGVTVQDRAEATLDRLQADLGTVTQRVTIDWPDAAQLAGRFRQDATSLANQQRAVIIDPLLDRRPGFLGRALRAILTLGVLLWFPLLQPLLAVLLPLIADGVKFDAQNAALVVTTLSGSTVLTGLSASLLVLTAIVAAIYARAVKHAHLAVGTLRQSGPPAFADLLTQAIVADLNAPLNKIRQDLQEITNSLQTLANRNPI